MERSIFRCLALVGMLLAPYAQAMVFEAPNHDFNSNFEWVNANGGLLRVYATGEIDENTGEEFDRYVKQNKLPRSIVFFNSSGGSLSGAIKLGKLIRQLGFDTGVASYKAGTTKYEGICASACAYAFAGGVSRYYKAGATRLGLHQFYSTDNVISNRASQEVSGLLVAYLQSMGVDALAFSASATAGPDEMFWLTADEAARLRFANNGEHATTSELKLQDNITYLKIEQEKSESTGRFLFYCLDKQIVLFAGMVTDPVNTKNVFEWATRSYLTVGNSRIQEERKEANPKGLAASGSVVWVNRTLTRKETQQLHVSSSIGTWTAADGFMSHGSVVDIRAVKGSLQNFVANCLK